MKVKELIEELQKHDGERLVVMSSDPEGNSYDTLRNIYTGAYLEEDNEIGLEKLTEENKAAGYGEEDVMTDGAPALIFWP